MNVLHVPSDGPLISTERDATDLIGDAWGADAQVVAVPVARLDPSFFQLSSGVAGAIAQKFVNYRLTLAVIGDVSAFTAASEPLAAWVRESNRGDQVWFLPDAAALDERVAGH
jgi:hypothetical protein